MMRSISFCAATCAGDGDVVLGTSTVASGWKSSGRSARTTSFMLVSGARSSTSCTSVVTSTGSFTVISFLPASRAPCYYLDHGSSRLGDAAGTAAPSLVRRRFPRGGTHRIPSADARRAVGLWHLRDPHDARRCTG